MLAVGAMTGYLLGLPRLDIVLTRSTDGVKGSILIANGGYRSRCREVKQGTNLKNIIANQLGKHYEFQVECPATGSGRDFHFSLGNAMH